LVLGLHSKLVETFIAGVEQDEDGTFLASVPTLPGCHTQARSIGELESRMTEAIALHRGATFPRR
jgi:predicted RNase H-like HicB family nuclease